MLSNKVRIVLYKVYASPTRGVRFRLIALRFGFLTLNAFWRFALFKTQEVRNFYNGYSHSEAQKVLTSFRITPDSKSRTSSMFGTATTNNKTIDHKFRLSEKKIVKHKLKCDNHLIHVGRISPKTLWQLIEVPCRYNSKLQ